MMQDQCDAMKRLMTRAPALASAILLTTAGLARSENAVDAYQATGWTVLYQVEGDLNRDEVPDRVTALQSPDNIRLPKVSCSGEEPFSQAPPRRLIVELSDGKGARHVAVDDANILLRSDEGGVFGDPFEGVSIERGALVISNYGGSRWRWGQTMRFRLTNGQWAMIGMTDVQIDSLSASTLTYDYNAVSGKMLVTADANLDSDIAEIDPLCVACLEGESCPTIEKGCYSGTKHMANGEQWFVIGDKPVVTLGGFHCWSETTGLLAHTGFQSGR